MERMKLIVKMKFGSHLYGTDTPESDTDYKGVFMPTKEQIYLNRIPKSINIKTKQDSNAKNTAEDVDTEIYSLHYFINLACEGEMVALDMLHAPVEMFVEYRPLWFGIISQKDKFYTKNLRAFVSYARRQASKYGVKGSRLNDAKKVMDYFRSFTLDLSLCLRLSSVWDRLPEGEHIFKHPPNENGERMYEVCGRKIGEKANINYALDIVKRFHDAYGERARKAADNIGIDWKAVSHAFRAAYQVKQILTEGRITFPLKEAEFLKQIKAGELPYQNFVAPRLDALIAEVEELSEKSLLPMNVNRKYWDDFIMTAIHQEIIMGGYDDMNRDFEDWPEWLMKWYSARKKNEQKT